MTKQTISPNQVGQANGTGFEWFGVGQWETLDVTLCNASGLSVDEMDGETVIGTFTGRDAIELLRAEGVKCLLAGSNLITI